MTTPLGSILASLTTDASLSLFPHEILGEILSHCDVATLASVSRVSFACLELTSKLLYTDITISDAKSVAMLLRLKSMAGTPPPLSDRVTAHTSRSLIHSVTLNDGGDLDVSVLDAHKPFPPPLAVEILAVSVPTTDIDQWGKGDLLAVNLRPVLDLFDPRILLLRGRRALLPTPIPNITRHVNLGRCDSTDWFPLPSLRLSVVIQSGATLGLDTLHVLRACVAQRTSSPLEYVWDLLDVQADPQRRMNSTTGVMAMGFFCAFNEDEAPVHDHVRAWLGSQEIKDGMVASDRHFGFESRGGAAGTEILQLPSARVRRLRDAFVKHGVRKDMDWAALDDL